MQVKLELLGRKLLVEARAGHLFIETAGHEFFYSRDWWFEGRSGRDRHWCLDKKTGQPINGCNASPASI